MQPQTLAADVENEAERWYIMVLECFFASETGETAAEF